MDKPIVVTVLLTVFLVGFLSGVSVNMNLPKVTDPIPSPTPSASPSCSHSEMTADAFLIDVNEYRLTKGLEPFFVDQRAKQYAQLRVDEIAQTGVVGHTSKYIDYPTWDSKQSGFVPGYDSYEIVVGNYPNACSSVRSWENSPTHNFALIRPGKSRIGLATNGQFAVGIVISAL